MCNLYYLGFDDLTAIFHHVPIVTLPTSMFAVHRTKAVFKQVVIVVARKHRKAQKMSSSGGETFLYYKFIVSFMLFSYV